MTCFVIEAVLRIGAYLEHRRNREALRSLDTVELAPEPGDTKLGHIIRRSEFPHLVYELRPNLDVVFINQPLHTNSDGMRSPPVSTSKPPGTVRILGLGDSVMFGWGVRSEQSYLRVMEERLRRRYPQVQWQVICGAVPGYNTAMEVEFLVRRGLRFQPDLVLIDFVGNDLDLPNFIWLRADYLSFRRSLLFELLRGPGRSSASDAEVQLVEAPLAATRDRYARRLYRVPLRYAGLVGPRAYRMAMGRLRRIGDQHGFQIAIVSHRRVPSIVAEMGEELSIPVIEADRAIAEYMAAHGVVTYHPSPLTLGPRDPHPSALSHRLQADAYLDGLGGLGFTQHLIAARGKAAQAGIDRLSELSSAAVGADR